MKKNINLSIIFLHIFIGPLIITVPISMNDHSITLQQKYNQAKTAASQTQDSFDKNFSLGTTENAPKMSNILGTLLVNSLGQQAGIDKLSELQKYGALAQFLTNLPQNFALAIKEVDYNEREFTITAQEEDQVLKIIYDLQSEASGSTHQPFGYVIQNEKFFFHPAVSVFLKEDLSSEGGIEQLNLNDPNLQNLLDQVLNIIPGGEIILDATKRIIYLYPEDIFCIKVLLLLASAHKNSQNALNDASATTNYPRLAHVPIELAMLFKRLSITPDYKATVNAHGGKTKRSSEWDLDNIAFFENGPSFLITKLPGVLREFVESITLNVYQSEYQEQNDRKNKVPTKMQKMYSAMRSIPGGYVKRNDFYLKNILTLRYAFMNESDKKLYLYALKKQIAERYSGFARFTEKYTSTDPNSNSLAQNPVPIDITKLLAAISMRGPSLLATIEKAIQRFEKINMPEIQNFKNELEKTKSSIQSEIQEMELIIKEIALSDLAALNVDTDMEKIKLKSQSQALGHRLLNVFKQIESQQDQQLINTNKSTRSLNFKDYLDLRHFQFQTAMNTRFRGDIDFLYDDSSLNTNQAINKSLAIILRAIDDLEKGEELFKNDLNSYQMISPDNQEITIVGQDIYQKTIANSHQYLASAEKNVEAARKSTDAMGVEQEYARAIEHAKKANYYVETLRTEFLHYLRQYPFDRRITQKLFAIPINEEIGDIIKSSLKTKEEIIAEDLRKNVEKIIQKNKIFGPNAALQLALIELMREMSKAQSKLQKKGYTETIEKEIEKQQQLILRAQNALTVIKNSLSNYESELKTLSEDPKPQVDTINKHETMILTKKEQIESVNAIIKNASDNIDLEKEKLTNFNAAKQYTSDLNLLIPNADLREITLSNDERIQLQTFSQQSSSQIARNKIFKKDDSSDYANLLSVIADIHNEQVSLTSTLPQKERVAIINYMPKLTKIGSNKTLQNIINSKDGLTSDTALFLTTEDKIITQIKTNNSVNIDIETELSNLKALAQETNEQEETPVDETETNAKQTTINQTFAPTIDHFLLEEFVKLMTQSKEFSKAGHLYINPVMRKNFGIDLSDLLDNATSQQSSYLDQDLKDLFSSNFQENLAKDIIPEEYINNAFGTVPAHMSLEELIIDSDNALAEQDLENIDTSASATNFTPEEMTQLQGLEGAGYDIQIGNEIEKQNENEYDKIIFHPNGSATLTKEGQADLALDSITTYMQISNLKEMQNNGTISALDQKTLNDYFTAYGTKATVPIVIFHNNGTATVTEEGKETKTLDRDSIKTIIDGIEMMRNWNTITAYQQALLNDYSAANEATITAGQAVSHQEQETPPVQAAKGRTATPTRPTTATTGIDTRQIGY